MHTILKNHFIELDGCGHFKAIFTSLDGKLWIKRKENGQIIRISFVYYVTVYGQK